MALEEQILVLLCETVGEQNVHTEKEKRMVYSFDGTFQNHEPDVIVKPHSAEEAATVVRIAAKYGVPLVARGAGTSLSGGPVALQGGIILEMTAFRNILEINEEEYYAVVEPGVITDQLIAQVEKRGLFYPPDPSSSGMSTIGGNVAECAGGGRGVKYGVTRDYVLEMEVITPDGDLITVGNKVDGMTGWMDWTMLFTGSEGTLGIITKVTLRLLKKPESIRTALAQYDELDAAARTVSAIIGAGIVPTTIEIMDQLTIRAVENFLQIGLNTNRQALVLLEVDGDEWETEEQMQKVLEICRANHVAEIQLAANDAERAAMWKARKSTSGACGKIRPTKIGEDVAVPPAMIPDMIKAVKKIAERYQLNMVVFGHAGDGNLHPNIMTDKSNAAEMKRVEQAIGDLITEALALGGTLSGEHGIGFMKAPYLLQELGMEGYQLQYGIKEALDPKEFMNPGKIFAESDFENRYRMHRENNKTKENSRYYGRFSTGKSYAVKEDRQEMR